MAFSDPILEDHELTERYCIDQRQCYACALQKKEDESFEGTKLADVISSHGRDYHLFDFVYYADARRDSLLTIGQITGLRLAALEPSSFDMKLLVRCEAEPTGLTATDPRLSVCTIFQLLQVSDTQTEAPEVERELYDR